MHQWADDDALPMFGRAAEMSECGHEEKKGHLGFGKCTWGLASPPPFEVSLGIINNEGWKGDLLE